MARARRRPPADDTVVLTDPRAVRALAHPARLAVIDALYEGRELTATECARLAGVSPSAMSYHLRALEKWGVVVRALERPDGRERPWRRAGARLSVDTSTHSAAAGTLVASTLITHAMDRDRQLLLEAVSRRPGAADEAWQHLTTYARSHAHLTPDEATALLEKIEALVQPYRLEQRPQPPEGARAVVVSTLLVPSDASPQP